MRVLLEWSDSVRLKTRVAENIQIRKYVSVFYYLYSNYIKVINIKFFSVNLKMNEELNRRENIVLKETIILK